MPSAFLHPFSDPAQPERNFINIVRAQGSTLWDDNGSSYIDGMASLWYCQVGHGRSEMIEAITTQLEMLDAYNTFAPFTNSVAVRAAEALRDICPLDDARVFFGCSGSEAVDTALKLARLVNQLDGDDERQTIVTRTRGYHGTNFGGTSAQGIAPNRAGWGDLVPHFIEVPADDIEAVSTVFAEHGDTIAAVLTEPVQGAGGVHTPPDQYLEGLRRLCNDHGSLLIFDEVITGFGRTGNWFAAQTFGVTPDLITFAKGASSGYQPVSGVIISRPVADRIEAMGTMLRTGYTYSGHPAGMAAVLMNLEILATDGLNERANHIGALISTGLQALADDGSIESFEGVGALWGAELGRESVPVRNLMLERGVIVRPIGTRVAMCPPLVISDEEIGCMLDTFATALEETRAAR